MNKIQTIFIGAAYFLSTVVMLYCAVSFGLGARIGPDFILSRANTSYALSIGTVSGAIVAFITLYFMGKESKLSRHAGLIIGILLEIVLFVGFFIHTAMIAAV